MNSNLPDDDLRENPAIRDRRGAIGLLLAALALVGGATGTGSASARQSRKRCPTRRRCGKRCCTRRQVCLSAGGGKRCVAAAGTCADAGTQTCNDNIDCACVVSVEGALRSGSRVSGRLRGNRRLRRSGNGRLLRRPRPPGRRLLPSVRRHDAAGGHLHRGRRPDLQRQPSLPLLRDDRGRDPLRAAGRRLRVHRQRHLHHRIR